MNDKTGGNRRPRRIAALAVLAAVAAGATACGGSSPSPASPSPASPASASPAPAGLASVGQLVALAHCMRGQGVPGFPDPSASGTFSDSNGRLDLGSNQVQRAYGACRHLLPGGGPDISKLQRQIQKKQEQALPVLLRFAKCMRGHSVPDFPDPSPAGLDLEGAGLDPASPLFQAAVQACQQVLPAGLRISLRTHESAGTHAG